MVNLMMVDDSLGTVTRNMASPFPPPNPAVPLPPRIVNLDPGDWIGVGFVGSSRDLAVIKRFSLTSGEESSVTFSPVTGSHITGRVVFDGGPPPASATSLRITTRPAGPAAGASPIPRVSAPMAADGSFELKNVFGTVDLQLASPVPGWMVASEIHGDRDLLDTPLNLNGGEDIRDVQVIMHSQVGGLTGTTIGAEGRPVPGCFVTLFPDGQGSLSPRRARLQRSDQNGRFALSDLVPGNYLAAAATDVDAAVWLTREYVQRLQPAATLVRLTGGTTADLELRCQVGAP
jgi:hypothetical protein